MHTPGLFSQIRPLCIAILKSPSASALIALVDILTAEDDLPPAIIEYVFFPLAQILRNTSTPDHILEHVFRALAVLAAHWDCSIDIWGQLVMLSTAVLAGPHDEETHLAAALTLRALVRPSVRLAPLPIIGRALDTLLGHTASPNHDLQITSLAVVLLLVKDFPGDDMPAILPGVVSTMARVALGPKTTAYAIQIALDVLAHAVQRAISDHICILHGALHDIRSLDDLLSPPSSQSTRTPSWLAGTASQLHIALNTLSPLVSHPNPIARLALANLALAIIQACPRSLEKSQSLLLSHLLVLAYPALSAPTPPEDARRALEHLHTLLADPLQIQPLTLLASQALSLLPHRLTPAHQRSASSLARQLVTACTVLPTIGALLGPSGGIEKWGRTLLTVLKFESRPLVQIGTAQDLISTHSAPSHPPPITLAALDADVHHHVQDVFIAMGNAARDQCAFAIEWFVAFGTRNGDDEMRVAALWCALMLLRGATKSAPSPRLTKAARWIITSIAELWDGRFEAGNVEPGPADDVLQVTEYVKGLDPLTTLLDRPNRSKPKVNRQVHLQHASLAIQLLSTSHMALCTTNSPASIAPLQYTLFPLLVSLVSDAPVLAWTAHTALGQISDALGYASVSNMLLANFDYALESTARRISLFSTTTPSTSISIQALQVLGCLIRLVGRAIVDRATDVLDECFDRLDDFHGYSAVVCALVGVLAQVVGAIGREDEGERIGVRETEPRTNEWEDFLEWFKRRNEPHDSQFDLGKKDDDNEDDGEPPPLSPSQSLTRQIVARATYFLTHASPHVRAQILNLLATAAPTLRASAFLPTIHAAWPFILNRLDDKEPFVVVACAQLVQALVQSVGEFMARRVWDDVWPRFKKILEAQAETAVTKVGRTSRLGGGGLYGPRALSDLHLAVLRTLGAAIEHVEPNDEAVWTILTHCRRFLAKNPSPTCTGRDEWGERRHDVQKAARDLYTAIGKRNPDVVWLVLVGTCGRDPRMNQDVELPPFLRSDEWDVLDNVVLVLNAIE